MDTLEYKQLKAKIDATEGTELVILQYKGTILPPIPDKFTTVRIEHCSALTSVSQIPSAITYFELLSCPEVQSLDVDFPASLTDLTVWFCPKLVTVGNLSKPTNMTLLWIRRCPLLTTIVGFPQVVQRTRIEECEQLTTLPPEFGASQGQRIFIQRTGLQQIPVFPTGLTSISIDINQLRSIGEIPPTVETLNIENNPLQLIPPIPRSVTHFAYTPNMSLDADLRQRIFTATFNVPGPQRLQATREAVAQFWRERLRAMGRNLGRVNVVMGAKNTNTPANWYAGPAEAIKALPEDVGQIIGSMFSGLGNKPSLQQQKNALRAQYERINRGGSRKRKAIRRRKRSNKSRKHK